LHVDSVLEAREAVYGLAGLEISDTSFVSVSQGKMADAMGFSRE
jgi:hypothetical protein